MKFLSIAILRNKKGRLYNIEITVKTNEVYFIVIGARKVIYYSAIDPVKKSIILPKNRLFVKFGDQYCLTLEYKLNIIKILGYNYFEKFYNQLLLTGILMEKFL